MSRHPIENFNHIVFMAYRCLDCNIMRMATCIPAEIDGEIRDDLCVIEDCADCGSQNINLLFRTKSKDEMSVFSQMLALDKNVK